MNTMDIANKLVELCRQGKNAEVRQTLLAADAVSIEPSAPPGMPREAAGLAAIQAKSEWWTSHHEIHAATVTGPWPHGDRFIVGFQYDLTHKPSGQRMQLDEVGLFTVAGGKITREEYFYSGGA
jgi:ketosteroid isomerase-like protein